MALACSGLSLVTLTALIAIVQRSGDTKSESEIAQSAVPDSAQPSPEPSPSAKTYSFYDALPEGISSDLDATSALDAHDDRMAPPVDERLVEVAALSSPESAAELVDQLEQMGFRVQVEKTVLDAIVIHRVSLVAKDNTEARAFRRDLPGLLELR